MSAHHLQPPGDKLKKALTHFSELLELKPEKTRKALLQEVSIRFDLSPSECEFLEKHFSDENS